MSNEDPPSTGSSVDRSFHLPQTARARCGFQVPEEEFWSQDSRTLIAQALERPAAHGADRIQSWLLTLENCPVLLKSMWYDQPQDPFRVVGRSRQGRQASKRRIQRPGRRSRQRHNHGGVRGLHSDGVSRQWAVPQTPLHQVTALPPALQCTTSKGTTPSPTVLQLRSFSLLRQQKAHILWVWLSCQEGPCTHCLRSRVPKPTISQIAFGSRHLNKHGVFWARSVPIGPGPP